MLAQIRHDHTQLFKRWWHTTHTQCGLAVTWRRAIHALVIVALVLPGASVPASASALPPVASQSESATPEPPPTDTPTPEPTIIFTQTIPPELTGSPEVRVNPTATFTPTVSPTLTLTPTIAFTPTLAATPPVTATTAPTPTIIIPPTITPPVLSNTVQIDPLRGGALSSTDGLLQLQFPAGAVSNTVQVNYLPRPLASVPASGPVALANTFELRALSMFDPGQIVTTFNQPLTMTVTLTGAAAQPLPRGQSYWLGYYDEATGRWTQVDYTVGRDADGKIVLMAPINHFSIWGSGINMDAGWLPVFNEPQTALFSGGAAYNHPVYIPPGRNGLQPQIGLSYNSRQIDGMLAWTQSNWAGNGWDLDMPMITREWADEASRNHAPGSMPANQYIWCSSTLRLNINGTGYLLVPGEVLTSSHYVRYYTRPESALRVERHNSDLGETRPANIGGEYWLVVDGSGTKYRLGATLNSEMVMAVYGDDPSGNYHCDFQNGNSVFYGGDSWDPILGVVVRDPWRAPVMWRLDQVTDVYGNQMVASYTEDFYQKCNQAADAYTNKASYLQAISYTRDSNNNWYTQIHFDLAPRPNNYDGHQACDRLTHQERYLQYIRVEQNGQLVRKYELGYAMQDNSDGSKTRLLTSIKEYGSDGASYLPITTFTYSTPLNNRQVIGYCASPGDPYWNDHSYLWECEQFGYKRLQEVQNGYGARTVFTYANDNQSYWTFNNYRVTVRQVYDGQTPNPARYDYAYANPCYSRADSYWGNMPGSHNCPTVWPDKLSGAITGYGVVTVTVTNYDNAVLGRTTHFYKTSENSSRLVGREYRTEIRDAANNLLTTQDQNYGVQDTTYGWDVYLDHQYSRTYDGSAYKDTRTSYTSDTYGNQTAVLNYGAEERVLDPGFEAGGAGWNSWPSAGLWSTTTAMAFAGRYSVQMAGGTSRMAWQDVTGLVNGQAYTVRVWVRAASGATTQVRLALHDGNSGNASGTSFATPSSTAWTLLSLPYTANATGKARVHIEVNTTGSGLIYADEVAVARAGDVGDERSSYARFYPNTDPSVWILNRQARQSVYAGIWPDDDTLSKLLSRTRYRYNDSCVTTLPTGPITATVVEQWQGGSGTTSCGYDAIFIATRTLLDSWGNVTAQSSPFTVGTPNIYTTTTQYDSVYRLYPITVTIPVTNGLSFSTYTQYDYRLGVPIAFTDPNNAIVTATYDVFGRLYEVYKPGDGSDPSQRYVYKDINTANPGPWLSPFTIVSWQKPNSLKYAQRHFYDGLGREIQVHTAYSVTLSSAASPADIVVSTRYNALGQVISQTVPYTVPVYVSGNPYTTVNLATAPKVLTQYDALGRPTTITAPDGTVNKQFYGLTLTGNYASAPWWSASIDANSHAKRSYANALGQTRWVQEFTGTCTTGNLSGCSVYATTQYSYTALSQLRIVTDTLNNTTVITYNVLGQKTEMKDPDMGTWKYAYDVAGRMISQTDALNQTLLFAYDAVNRMVQKRVNGGAVLATYFYDEGQNGKGQRTRMVDLAGVTTWRYDQLGQVISQTQGISITSGIAKSFTTLFLYDVLGRPISTTLPTNETITQTYNNLGALENVKSLSTTYGSPWYATNLDYNANGSLAKLELGNGVRTLYGYYGLQGNPWDIRPGNATVSYGRLWEARTETLWGATVQDNRYSYDNVGNITGLHTLPRHLVVTATATLTDAFLGPSIDTSKWHITQTVGTVSVVNTTAQIACTGGGCNVGMERKGTLGNNQSAQVKFQVNNAAATFVIGLESGTKQTSSYRRLAVYAYNNALWVQYYDGAGNGSAFRTPTMLTSTLAANTWYTVTITTSNTRGQTIELYKQGDQATYERHAAYTILLATGVNWRFHAWGPSASGHTLTLDDYREFGNSQSFAPDEHQTYTYDELDRLKAVNKTFTDGYTAVYTYTATGNLTGKTENAASATYTYPGNGQARPHAALTMGGNSYAYNLNGDMLTRTENGISYTQQWDKENRLQVVTNTTANPDIISTFFYNGDGARVKKIEQVNTTITTTFYAGAIEVISTTQLLTRTYYFAAGQMLGVREVTNTTAGNLYYLHSDHLGSTSTTTCGNTSGCGATLSGGVLMRQSYYPYGGVRQAGNLPTDRTYTGQVEDDLTGLMYYNARYYASGLGRFISADTIVPGAGNPQAFNRYSYVLGNPLKYTDPSGHAQTCGGDSGADCGEDVRGLYFNGDPNDIQRLLDVLNGGLSGYSVRIGKDGHVYLLRMGGTHSQSASQLAMHDQLVQAIGSPQQIVMSVVSGDELILGDSYPDNTIDVDDLERFGKAPGVSAQTVAIHSVVEQTYKQETYGTGTLGYIGYLEAHNYHAIPAEEAVANARRMDTEYGFLYTYRDGTTVETIAYGDPLTVVKISHINWPISALSGGTTISSP